MTPPHAQPVSVGRSRADAAARAEPIGPFVVNLCASTTPMALSQPQDPELKRFSFFVSRRREDGRERFRLHMGYFETLEEAEEWVAVVREFYPGAWAGETPGKRLRAVEQAEAVAPRQDLPPPRAVPVLQPAPAASPVEPDPIVLELVEAPIVVAAAPAPAEAHRGVAAASPPAAGAAPAARVTPAASAAPAARVTPATQRVPAVERAPAAQRVPAAQPISSPPAAKPPASAAATGASRGTPKPAPVSAAPAKPAVAKPVPAKPAPAKLVPAKPVAASPVAASPVAAGPVAAGPVAAGPVAAKSQGNSTARLSNVGEVLASLDDAGATREMPAAALRAEQPQAERSSLSDSQVLRMLEARDSSGKSAAGDSSISLLKPDDTGTRRALKDAVASNAPVSFAVQLQWSVQAIDVTKVPPLAIFGAYTLYTVEGSREGRRWYGLRLGFFSDAISAKQVAYYVRSEFNSVAVVPVSPQERSRAGGAGGDTRTASPGASPGASPADAAKPAAARSPVRDRLPPEPTSEFKLLEDEPKAPPAPKPEAPAAKPRAAAPSTKRAAKGPAGRVRARDKRSPQTLEETLEILGADELEIDDGRAAETSPKSKQALKVPERKNSPFAKLLDRLAERSRKAR